MKIISSIISFSSVIAMSFAVGTTAIASATTEDLTSNHSSLLLENTRSTTLLAQNGIEISEPQGDLCITTRFCLVNKIPKEGGDQEDDYYAYYPSFWGHGFLVIAAGVIISGAFIGLRWYAIRLSKKWMDDLIQKNSAQFSIETVEFPKNVHESIKDNSYCAERLKQQLSEIHV